MGRPSVIESYFNKEGMLQNAIVDSNFQIAQVNPTVGTEITNPANGTFPVFDLWKTEVVPGTGTHPTVKHSQQLITSGLLSNSKYCYRINSNGAGTGLDGATSYYGLIHNVEYGVQSMCGLNRYITLSFWARSTIANKRIGAGFVEYYGTGGSPSGAEFFSNTTGKNWTLSSLWLPYSGTFLTNTLTGKVFGSNNDDYLAIRFWLQWGTSVASYVGASTAESFVGAGDIEIAQVQLNGGTTKLPFAPKPFDVELSRCMRHYEKSYNYSISPGTASTLSGACRHGVLAPDRNYIIFRVPKRVNPNFRTYSSSTGIIDKIYNLSTSSDIAVNYDSGTLGQKGTMIYNGSISSGDIAYQWAADARI